jgi:hypothetical protein
MAQDAVAVANLALSKIGAERINFFSDDSNSARVISQVYADVRDEVLVTHAWTFAQKRNVLSQVSDPIIWSDDTMKFKYAIPTDFLKLISFNIPNAFVRFESDGILSDTNGLKILYTFRNDDPTTYFPLFTAALVVRLAYEVCFNLVESTNKSQALWEEYQEKLNRAIAGDSQQGTPNQVQQDEWESMRIVGGNAMYSTPGRATWTPVW